MEIIKNVAGRRRRDEDGKGVTRAQVWSLNWAQPSPSRPGLFLLPVDCSFAWASGILGPHSIRRERPLYLPQASWPPTAALMERQGLAVRNAALELGGRLNNALGFIPGVEQGSGRL